MGTRAAVVGILALAACGDNDLPPHWSSGARLQARVHVTDDGYEGLVGWRDVEAGSECWAGDHTQTLCAPGFQRLWIDAACTMAASQWEITTPYVTIGGRAYRATGAMGNGRVYLSSGGECRMLSFPALDYWLVEEVPPETLASWVIEQVDDDGRVHKKTSPDGAFEYVVDGSEQRKGGGDSRLRPIWDVIGGWHDQNGVWDTAIDLPCTIGAVNGTEQLACLPTMVQPQLLHRSATCTDPGVRLSMGDMGMDGRDVYDRRVTERIWQGFSAETCAQLPDEARLFERSRSIDDFRAAAVRLELR